MADQTTPSSRSQQANQVSDAKVKDATHAGKTDTKPGVPSADPSKNDRVTSREHPLSSEPRERVQHADREPPASAVQRGSPTPLSPKDQERFEYLRSKDANPNVLPPHVRTEDEEHEYRQLSQAVSAAEEQAAMEAAQPYRYADPKDRLAELKRKGRDLGEGETIELRRIEELLHDEKRIAELKRDDKRVVEEDEELARLQQRVAEARAAGGFDPNG